MSDIPQREIIILDRRVYLGPNLFDHGRGILLTIDLGDLELEPTLKIPKFTDRLIDLIPSLQEHGCSYGVPGGFIRRMTEDDGTWLGHVLEHVAIEIQSLAGSKVTYGKTRQVKNQIGRTGKESVYRVYYEFQNEETALSATELALRIVNSLVSQNPLAFSFEQDLEEVILMADRFAYGPSTGSIVSEATSRGIPSIRLEKESSLVQMGYGKNQKRIWASTSTNSSYIATEIAQDKELTLQLLYDVGIPVPRGGVVRSLEDAFYQAERVDFPLVTKPLDVSHGRGVSLNISNVDELKKGFEFAKKYTRSVIVERYINGKDFRLLVINGQFVAASERVPAHVIGNGSSNVKQLIEVVNTDPRRGVGHEKVLTRIYIDDNSKRLLSDQGLSIKSIPSKGQFVQLKSTANLSTGGTARDVTDIIHFDNIQLAERAVKTIGLDIAGVDIMAPEITTPIKTNGGVIIEVNAAPGFRMHLEPTEGTPRNVAKHVIDMLFPNDFDGRIPLISVTGTNGKTTVARWIAHTLKLSGNRVGLTTTDGIYIDGTLEYSGDCTGPWSARVVLRDPTVNFAILETARGGILREGLGWDSCDVAILLNVSDDHLGLRGINSVEEMAEVKGVILDQVRKEGYGVVNADDQLVMKQRNRIKGKTILVTLDYKNQELKEHSQNGGTGVTITPNGVIQLIEGRSQKPITHVKDIPATINGHAIFAIQNAMFTVAAVYPFVSIEGMRAGLSTFSTNFVATPGRMNIERVKGARIIIDYGHNPSALKAQLQVVEGFHDDQGKRGRKAIVFGLPGDRLNSTIKDAAKVVANRYDHYFIKEDWDLRGRKSGEIIFIIQETLSEEGVTSDKISVFSDDKTELDAVTSMFDWLKLNDIVILQADDIIKVRNHLMVNLAKSSDTVYDEAVIKRGDSENQSIDFAKVARDLHRFKDETSD